MKKGIALAGGGSLGIYELGAWKAFNELKMDFDIITGTSIGALNGAMMTQGDYDTTYDLWKNIKIDNVIAHGFNVDEMNITKILKHTDFKSFFKSYVKGRGGDITPLKDIMNEYLNYDKIRSSDKKFGVVVTQFPIIKREEVMINNLSNKDMFNYVLASASLFPVFPTCKINDKQYIDGGYLDNLSIEFNFRLGADHVVAVDLYHKPTHEKYLNHPLVDYIHPKWDLGSLLNFEEETLSFSKELGYYDTMKFYGKYDGYRFIFNKPENIKVYEEKGIILTRQMIKDEVLVTGEKSDLVKRLDTATVFDHLNKYIYKTPSNYDYLIKCLEEIAVIFDMEIIKEYNIEDFVKEIQDKINVVDDSVFKTEFESTNSIVKKRDLISAVNKQVVVKYLYNNKMDDKIRVSLFKLDLELYLSLLVLNVF